MFLNLTWSPGEPSYYMSSFYFPQQLQIFPVFNFSVLVLLADFAWWSFPKAKSVLIVIATWLTVGEVAINFWTGW